MGTGCTRGVEPQQGRLGSPAPSTSHPQKSDTTERRSANLPDPNRSCTPACDVERSLQTPVEHEASRQSCSPTNSAKAIRHSKREPAGTLLLDRRSGPGGAAALGRQRENVHVPTGHTGFFQDRGSMTGTHTFCPLQPACYRALCRPQVASLGEVREELLNASVCPTIPMLVLRGPRF